MLLTATIFKDIPSHSVRAVENATGKVKKHILQVRKGVKQVRQVANLVTIFSDIGYSTELTRPSTQCLNGVGQRQSVSHMQVLKTEIRLGRFCSSMIQSCSEITH